MEPATVTGTSPLMVCLYTSTTSIPAVKLDSYTTPVIGDRVAVVQLGPVYLGSQMLVTGKVV